MSFLEIARRFSIRTRLTGTLLVMLAALLLIGGTGWFGMQRIERSGADVVASELAEMRVAGQLRDALAALRRHEKDMIINYEKIDEVQRYHREWQAALKNARAVAGRLADNAELGADAKALAGHLDGYAKLFAPVAMQLLSSGFDTATVANKLLGPAKQEAHAAEKLIAAIEQKIELGGEAAAVAMAADLNRMLALLALAVGVALAVVVPTTLLNVVSICRPLEAAGALARRIAGGDLSGHIDTDGADETAALQRELAQMQASLGRMIREVHAASGEISVATGEVAQGNADLSGRTEQAASSLQQTASSMEQITGTVRHSADAAAQANELAASAAAVAQRGGHVVSQVVGTMDEIQASSRKIADITGVIDGIAFQTNILALNAAVEAARAGEQGRGFAVVAGEVRSLAQRSAEAAKQIKGLIGASVDKVASGSRLVQDAGSTMSEIQASVQRVSDIIGQISAATAEQSTGIGEVNTAVGELDRMTQQNAALVEQSAAAAASLQDQADRLAGAVASFRLAAESGAHGRSPITRVEPHDDAAPRSEPAGIEPTALTQALKAA